MSARRDTILVAGSANLDFVVRAPHIPAPGETVLGGVFATYAGGKGANQAVAAARAGARTRMLVALGDDAYAIPIEASLRDAGVALDVVRVAGESTGIAFVVVSDAAENAITVAAGANAKLADEDLPELECVSHLLLQLETPLAVVEAYAACARAAGVSVILNAAPAQPLSRALLASIDILIVNEGELAVIDGGAGSLRERLGAIEVETVIVTLGRKGSCARVGRQFHCQPAFEVSAIDTTGAGDTFCGAFSAALGESRTLADALVFASAAAAIACTRAGAQSSIPGRAEIEALVANHHFDAATRAALAAYCDLPSA